MRFRELLEAPDPLTGLPPLGGDAMGGGIPPEVPVTAPKIISNNVTKKRSKKEMSADAKISTALSVIFDRIAEGDLKSEVKLKTVLNLVRNITGMEAFDEDELKDAQDRDPAIKAMIKNITPETVEFKTGETNSFQDELNDESPTKDPTDVVGDMAKSALKRRQ